MISLFLVTVGFARWYGAGREPEIQYSGFGGLVNQGSGSRPSTRAQAEGVQGLDEDQNTKNSSGFGGMLKQETGTTETLQLTSDRGTEEQSSLENTETQRIENRRPNTESQTALSDLGLASPSPLTQTDSASDLKPQVQYPVIARRTWWQKGIDAVADSVTAVRKKVFPTQPSLAYDSDLYQYAKARQLAKEQLTKSDKNLLELDEKELSRVMVTSVLQSQQETIGAFSRDALGNLTLKTNLEGVALGVADPAIAYRLEVEPVAEVDVTVASRYLAVEDFKQVEVILLGLKPGSGQVHYGNADNAGLLATNLAAPLGSTLVEAIRTYASQPESQLNNKSGLIAIQLFNDANANGLYDSDEKPVPWAGVTVRLGR